MSLRFAVAALEIPVSLTVFDGSSPLRTMTAIPELPILRQGRPYTSLDVAEVTHVATGEPAIRVSQANSGMISRDLLSSREPRNLLRRIPAKERVEMVRRAGAIF